MKQRILANGWLALPLAGIVLLGALSQWGGPAAVVRATVVVVCLTGVALSVILLQGWRRGTLIVATVILAATAETALSYSSVSRHLQTHHHGTTTAIQPAKPRSSGAAAAQGPATAATSNIAVPSAGIPRGDLASANLPGAALNGADLQGRNMAGAILAAATLRGANLIGANLAGADLESADLAGANLTGSCLRGTQLRNANLDGADLTGADTHGAQLPTGFNATAGHTRTSAAPAPSCGS